MSKTTTIYHRDGRERTLDVHEASRLTGAGQVGAGKDWSFVKPPPLNWERETPKFRATRDLHSALKERHRHEPPFGMTMDNDCWQYAPRAIKAGETIETKSWPHPSLYPLNYSAGKVLDFFNSRQKSRLPRSPWQGDRLVLDDGLSGPIRVEIGVPQLKSMGLRPAS
jgi:hypothetical protein